MQNFLTVGLLAIGVFLSLPQGVIAETTVQHGTSLTGTLKYEKGYYHLDYVNPSAPKGGYVKQYSIGSFDSLNPFILKGTSAASIGLVFETLMKQPEDELSAMYGLIAETIEFPDDYSWAVFNLRPEARWHDGAPITADDVVFTFDLLTTKGHPFYRAYYANVETVEAESSKRVKFTFKGDLNRELPHIVGQLTVLPKAYFDNADFSKTTLEPIMGSGPYRVLEVNAPHSITYQRVKNYWGQDLPINKGQYNFDRIRVDYYMDQTVALEAFKAGEYDFRRENSARRWATGYDSSALSQGDIRKEEIRHELPTGMQAFVFNTRRPIFNDRRVRNAIGHAFDFEWSNKTLFYGQYDRTNSYFSNSELAARGLPSVQEVAYLEPFRSLLPSEVFDQEYKAPKSDGSGSDRRLLRRAKTLLQDAGWIIRDNRLIHSETLRQMEIEFLLNSPDFERIVQPFARNLERLGIFTNIRTVDTAQYQNRVDGFDFDIVVATFPQSDSPGNEQRDYWGSVAADTLGGRNLIGVKDEVVDTLIDRIIYAPDRESLVAASRALDRVLLWRHYVVPQFHSRTFRVAYWKRFGRPEITPKYGIGFFSWWIDSDLESEISRSKGN